MARVILLTLGGFLIILVLLSAYEWIVEEYPRRPTEPPRSERIQHPFYHEEATKVLQRFSRLPKSERAAIRKKLESGLISLGEWLEHLVKSDYQIICIGELHEESTRDFLAEEFFANFSTDVLLLEATPQKLDRLIKKMEAGREYFPLLKADIMNILRTVNDRNPAVEIRGIEQTGEQQKDQRGNSNPRDQSIALNFWGNFQPGRRHVILFGALHCTNESDWLFKNLREQAPLPLSERMLNVQVLGEHQNGPLEAFVYFLDEIGIEKRSFVIPDTSALHPLVYELFPSLSQQILEKYCSLLVFRGGTSMKL